MRLILATPAGDGARAVAPLVNDRLHKMERSAGKTSATSRWSSFGMLGELRAEGDG